MKRSVVAAIVPLILSFGIMLIPAAPASAATSTSGGTSLAQGNAALMRVPTVLDAHPSEFDCNLGPGSPTVPVMRLGTGPSQDGDRAP